MLWDLLLGLQLLLNEEPSSFPDYVPANYFDFKLEDV